MNPIWFGFLFNFDSSSCAAGNISALCVIGAEKVFSARSCGPLAMATEPLRPEVSTANIKGSEFWWLLLFFMFGNFSEIFVFAAVKLVFDLLFFA